MISAFHPDEIGCLYWGLKILLMELMRGVGIEQVTMLLEWSSANNCEFSAALPGPNGITPLHMAAILEDGGQMAALLTGTIVSRHLIILLLV